MRIQGILEDFKQRWIALSRHQRERSVDLSSPNGESKNGNGRDITKIWHSAWAPYAQALDNFRFTEPSESRDMLDSFLFADSLTARALPTRLASFNMPAGRPVSPSKPQTSSSSDSSVLRAAPPPPENPSASSSSTRRPRASSLVQKVQSQSNSDSPIKQSPSSTQIGRLKSDTRPSKGDMGNCAARPSSFSISNNNSQNRYSFGLPRITAETGKIFDGLGLSPAKLPTGQGKTPGLRATSDPHAYADVIDPVSVSSNGNAGLGFPFMTQLVSDTPPQDVVPTRSDGRRPSGSRSKVEAAEGWRNEPVLYQCACVADL